MKITVLFAVCLVIFCVLPTGGATTHDPFSIQIAASEPTSKQGSDVRLEIVLTNTSHEVIELAKEVRQASGEINYRFDVRTADGKAVPETDYGRTVKGIGPSVIVSSTMFHPVKPGDTLLDEVILSKVFDMSRVGKYSIRAWRSAPAEVGGGKVRSNEITITIVD